MNIFTLFFITALMPPILATRWALTRCGIKDPSDGQIIGTLVALMFLVIWVSGWWLTPTS